MAYRDDITALSPDHFWPLEADSNDDVGLINGTDTSITYTSTSCCEDATNAAQTNAVGDRIAFTTSTDINGDLDRKVVCGWLRVSQIQGPPKSIWREGTTGNQFNIVMWAGNVLMLDIVRGSPVLQGTRDQIFQPNRNYHIPAVFEGTGFADRTALYIDGVEQSGAQDAGSLTQVASRAAAEMADPSGSTEVGNATVLLNSPVNGFYNFWATFSGANAVLTNTEIREELFEKGALASQTISSDTEANMQTALDAFSDTARGDEPCNFRVEALSGGGDLTLTADNITHDAQASIHVQYMGTDTLTWVNENGSNGSIGSTPNGGTINFVESVNLTITCRDASTNAVIEGARVLMEADTGGPLSPGTDILIGVTNVSGQVTGTLQYSSDQPITGKIRKGTTSPLYKTASIAVTITSSGVDLTVFMVPDE